MIEKKWTPGPWFIDDELQEHCCHETAIGAKVPYGSGMYGKDVGIIVEVWGNDNYADNANLIAAAPELYEALDASLIYLECCCDADGNDAASIVLRAARAALSKARGVK